jgi:hypothetical protein
MATMPPKDPDQSRSARFAQIFSRLVDLPGYSWDTEIEPFHSVRKQPEELHAVVQS